MTDISPSAAAARENARQPAGQFGEQQHTTPETALSEPSAREKRVQTRSVRLRELQNETDQLTSLIKADAVGELWEVVPVHADAIVFESYDSGYGAHLEYVSVIDGHGDDIDLDYDDEYRDAASWFDADDIDFDDSYSAHVIAVGKDATRARIIALEEEYRTGDSGRSGGEISDDSDIAVTRYLRQVAAEQGWESIELDWEQGGREGLRAVAITSNGKRRKAGSGHLDDHEAIWAAARYPRPVPGTMTAPQGVRGPFHIDF